MPALASVVIPIGTNLSDPITDIVCNSTWKTITVKLPAAWTAANLALAISRDAPAFATYDLLYSWDASLVMVSNPTVNNWFVFPPEAVVVARSNSIRVKIASVSALGVAVNQVAARTLWVLLSGD